MTEEQFIELFEKYKDNFLEFADIKVKFSKRPDLHALILLDSLVTESRDIIACAEHDQIWLGVDISDLVKVIREDQVVDLIRSGIFLDDCCLSMFV